ncbi:hypothetical protein ACFUCV_01225 [Specibacter sp. NPDC057265]|uniref:hypothetical protein n=1 Tax=Specibacter sp. NPDC057265 TaxID=3346075 RepID=UPI0036340108
MITSTITNPRKPALMAALAITALAVLAAPAAPAVAQGVDEVSLAYSSNGVDYSAHVPDLFAHAPKLVPGESVEEQLWVRNDHAVPVDISLAALTGGPQALQPAEAAPQSFLTLDPGAAGTLPVRMWLPVDSDNDSQAQTWPLQLRVNVSEAVPGAGGRQDNGGTGTLANTGARPWIWPLGTALLLGGLGAWFGSRSRPGTRGQSKGGTMREAQL